MCRGGTTKAGLGACGLCMLHVLDNFMITNDFGLPMQGDTCAAYLEMQMTFRAK
jgi:hypothetical protein